MKEKSNEPRKALSRGSDGAKLCREAALLDVKRYTLLNETNRPTSGDSGIDVP